MRLTLTGESARKAACRHILASPEGYVVSIQAATRSLEQNAALWAALTDLSRQTDWHGIKLSPDRWKERSKTFHGIADAMSNQCGSSPQMEFAA